VGSNGKMGLLPTWPPLTNNPINGKCARLHATNRPQALEQKRSSSVCELFAIGLDCDIDAISFANEL
jgi:hypothetical protein